MENPNMSEPKEYRINEFLTLKLEDQKTFIYVKGKKFLQCLRLILNIPLFDTTDTEDVKSIDHAAEIFKSADPEIMIEDDTTNNITPEQEFIGHCSNIQAWYEHDYDTRLIHSNLAFPLLAALTRAGDSRAKRFFKEEIVKRLLEGTYNVIEFLFKRRYLDNFTKGELEVLGEKVYEKLRKGDYKYIHFLMKEDSLRFFKEEQIRKIKYEFLKLLRNRSESALKQFFKGKYWNLFTEKELEEIFTPPLISNIEEIIALDEYSGVNRFFGFLKLFSLSFVEEKEFFNTYRKCLFKILYTKIEMGEMDLIFRVYRREFLDLFTEMEIERIHETLLVPIKQGNSELIKYLLGWKYFERFTDEEQYAIFSPLENLDIKKILSIAEENAWNRFIPLIKILSNSLLTDLNHIKKYKQIIAEEVMRVKDWGMCLFYCHDINEYGDTYFRKVLSPKLEKRLRQGEYKKDYVLVHLIQGDLLKLLSIKFLKSFNIKEINFPVDDEIQIPNIPKEFGCIISLEKITLGYENLIHTLPDSIDHLKNLRVLILEDIKTLEKFPKTILNLKNLRKVVLPLFDLNVETISLFLKHKELMELIFTLWTDVEDWTLNLIQYKQILNFNQLIMFSSFLIEFRRYYYSEKNGVLPIFFNMFLEKLNHEKNERKKEKIHQIILDHLEIYYGFMCEVSLDSRITQNRDNIKKSFEKYGISPSLFHKELTRRLLLTNSWRKKKCLYEVKYYKMLSEKDLKELLEDPELKLMENLDDHYCIRVYRKPEYRKIHDKWQSLLKKE